MINQTIIKKEDALNILDRIIGFVSNCDYKTSIVLGIWGIIIAAFFEKGTTSIIELVGTKGITCGTVLYLISLVASIGVSIYGICHLIRVLVPNVKCPYDSVIFFGKIAGYRSFEQYKEKLLGIDDEKLLDDIISQIYVNSQICTQKFADHKKGLSYSVKGFSAFFLLWSIRGYVF